MHKYTTLYVHKYIIPKLINIKSDNIRLLLQKVMLRMNYILNKLPKEQ